MPVNEINLCNMWTFLLSLFLFAGASAIEINCDTFIFDACPQPELFRRIPREVEELYALCPETPPYIECALAYNRKCLLNENLEKLLIASKALAEEICDEGTNLNEIFTSNPKCFNETITNTNCVQERKDFLESYKTEYLVEDSRYITYTIPENVHCLNVILFVECLLSDITQNCGLRAGYGAAELVRRTLYLEQSCPSSHRENLLEDIDEFDLNEEQKTFATAELRRLESSDNA